MTDASSRQAFLAALSTEAQAALRDDASIDESLARAWQLARAQWPRVEVPVAAYFTFLGARTPVAGIEGMEVADLYLTCACLRSDPVAIAAFDRVYLARAERALSRQGEPAEAVADVVQHLRVLLLVATPDRAPDLAGYAGRSDLHAWLRVVALREAARFDRREARALSISQSVGEPSPPPDDDPELAYVKARYRRDVATALVSAVRRLRPRERALLRAHLAEARSIDDLATDHAVHRATAARWLERARARLATLVRAELERSAGIDPTELADIFALVRSRLELSVRRLLASNG